MSFVVTYSLCKELTYVVCIYENKLSSIWIFVLVKFVMRRGFVRQYAHNWTSVRRYVLQKAYVLLLEQCKVCIYQLPLQFTILCIAWYYWFVIDCSRCYATFSSFSKYLRSDKINEPICCMIFVPSTCISGDRFGIFKWYPRFFPVCLGQ